MKIIDLSLPYKDGMPRYSRQQVKHIEDEGYNTSNLTFYSHVGTHMDAPLHFLADGASIADWKLEQCAGTALVVDLTASAGQDFITPADLSAAAAKITAGTRLLLRTDWDQHFGTDTYSEAFPRISVELAHWLAERKIALLGLETPSVASLNPQNRDELKAVHRILLGAGIIIVESLANLREIQQEEVFFIAFPLKIEGSDGSPVRAAALPNW